jgi:ligand-binding sensor domain-containing protein
LDTLTGKSLGMRRPLWQLGLGVLLVLGCAPLAGWMQPAPDETHPSTQPMPISTPLAPAAMATGTSQPAASTMLPAVPQMDFSPLQAVIPGEELPAGQIVSLWVDEHGDLWVSGSMGVYRHDGDQWLEVYPSSAGQILGKAGDGRVWVLLAGGAQIMAFDSQDWTVFGEQQGWQPVAGGDYLSRGFGDGLVTDRQGRLWLATGGDDLRRFDPVDGRWQRFTAQEIGFQPPEDDWYQGHFLTDVLLSKSGRLWVANCIGVGESLDGQGIRRFDGESWQGTPFTAQDCIFDLEMDERGVVWAGALNSLLRYDPARDTWQRIALPLWGRLQVVVDVTLDDQGRPWVELLRAGGASLDGGAAQFYLHDGDWVPVLELSTWQPNSLTLGQDGTAWVFWDGGLYHYTHEGLQTIAPLTADYAALAVDGRGRVWVARLISAQGQLWWYDPPLPD